MEQAAAQLRTEVSSKNLTAYYYKFTLPDNLTTGAFTGQLTFKMNSSSDRLSTPTLYSYILMYNRLKYYTSGSFETAMGAIPEKGYTFDQVRLTVGGAICSDGYDNEFPGISSRINNAVYNDAKQYNISVGNRFFESKRCIYFF